MSVDLDIRDELKAINENLLKLIELQAEANKLFKLSRDTGFHLPLES